MKGDPGELNSKGKVKTGSTKALDMRDKKPLWTSDALWEPMILTDLCESEIINLADLSVNVRTTTS